MTLVYSLLKHLIGSASLFVVRSITTLFTGGEVTNIDNNVSAVVTPAMVLQFFTGCDREPPGGFPFTPKITFKHESNSLPTANTCAGRLALPVCDEMLDPDTTIQWFGSLLLNSLGFGLV